MKKDQALKFLDDFYNEMKKAEQLAYISCEKRDARMKYLLDKYADILVERKDNQ